MPWILFQGDLDGVTVPGGGILDVFPDLTGLIVNPLNDGGTVDPTIYGGIDLSDNPVDIMTAGSSNEPFKAVQILQPGLYYLEVGMTWYYDWVIQEPFAERWVTVRHEVTHTDIETSVISTTDYALSNEQTYIGLVPQGGDLPTMPIAFQMTARTYLAIDERATGVKVRGLFTSLNEFGADRTYNNTDRTGSYTFYLLQLSPTGHSNP